MDFVDITDLSDDALDDIAGGASLGVTACPGK
jgi:hypothetical protein